MNDRSEQEQLEDLRTWWRENGWFIAGGLALGVVLMIGWNLWGDRRLAAQMDASMSYESLVEQVADGDLDAAGTQAMELFARHDDTPYAAQGRLAMARLYMDRGRDQDAADVLRPLAGVRGDDVLSRIARHRLARILLYQDQPQAVLDLVGSPADDAFKARFGEVLGDAHVALGNVEAARSAYQAVLADPGASSTVNTGLVSMKLEDLPAAERTDSGSPE